MSWCTEAAELTNEISEKERCREEKKKKKEPSSIPGDLNRLLKLLSLGKSFFSGTNG